jgi:hypothetical protein
MARRFRRLDESATSGFEKFRFGLEVLQDPEFSEYVSSPISLSILSSLIATQLCQRSRCVSPTLYDAVTSFDFPCARLVKTRRSLRALVSTTSFVSLILKVRHAAAIDSSTGTRDYRSILVMWNMQIYGEDEDGFAQFKLVPSLNFFKDNGWVKIWKPVYLSNELRRLQLHLEVASTLTTLARRRAPVVMR